MPFLPTPFAVQRGGRTDPELWTEIQGKLKDNSKDALVDVVVENGIVDLEGRVATKKDRNDAYKLARSVEDSCNLCCEESR